MIQKTAEPAELRDSLGEVTGGADRLLRCAICRRRFPVGESNGTVCWMARGATEKAVLHVEHRCENCLIEMAYDIDRAGRFADCNCDAAVLETIVVHQHQPFCPLFD